MIILNKLTFLSVSILSLATHLQDWTFCCNILDSMWLQESLKGNLWIHKGKFPRTTEHEVPHLFPIQKNETTYSTFSSIRVIHKSCLVWDIFWTLPPSSSLENLAKKFSKVSFSNTQYEKYLNAKSSLKQIQDCITFIINFIGLLIKQIAH